MSSACILLRCNRAVFINPLIDQAGILALLDGFVDELKEVLVALRDCNSGILVANVLRKLRVTQNQIWICDKVRLCNSRLDNNAVCLIGGQLENGERDFSIEVTLTPGMDPCAIFSCVVFFCTAMVLPLKESMSL